MKKFFKTILKFYLKLMAKLVLVVNRPKIIAVAGSLNKTFVRDEIKRVLEEKGVSVRANPKNFNTEIGLPLAILNISSGYNSYREWWPIIGKAFCAVWQKNFPKVLVLEFGVSNVGDMKYLLTIAKPEISVITNITQRYLESFPGMNDLVSEFAFLVSATRKSGAVILNYDNLRVKELIKKSKAPVYYFGKTCEGKSDFQILEISKTATGQLVKIGNAGKQEQISISRFGEHHAYALSVGLIVKKVFKK